MLSRRPIRVKLSLGLALLVLVVTILAGAGLYATNAYRDLVKSLRQRARELPVAAELSQQVSELRIMRGELHGLRSFGELRGDSFYDSERSEVLTRVWTVRRHFSIRLDELADKLGRYRRKFEREPESGWPIADNQREWETVRKIEAALSEVRKSKSDEYWIIDERRDSKLDENLRELQALTDELPGHLHGRLAGLADDAKWRYRTLIYGTWVVSVSAGVLFLLFVKLSWRSILQPLRTLIHGSRKVAGGNFSYRIRLDSEDEMAELAEALNAMTSRFEHVRDDLDSQVRERTKQVVRSEQLASVGFLAAGVAHEINNPLASIAMCAESLQGRLAQMLPQDNPENDDGDRQVIDHYLQMIQDEAFRCKGITEKLLDFSRVGQVSRQNTDLGELVQSVVDMVGHLGRYRRKEIEFTGSGPVIAAVNPQEIKQVVLNLLTNALDSTGGDAAHKGTVRIELHRTEDWAELAFTDDGCGMTLEVLDHVFEPFFTSRRVGQGTGLGLSISYRIVADHGGEIRAESPGEGLGATFRMRLPYAAVTSANAKLNRQAA